MNAVTTPIWSRRLSALIALVGLALVAGCIETDPAEVSLSWTLPDGQTCQEAGVADVVVEVSASTAAEARFMCNEGLAPRSVRLGAFEPGLVVVRVKALDADEALRFSAEGRAPIDEGNQSFELHLEPAQSP